MSSVHSIAVAMSGGVDSSVAAALLKREGHEVIGLTMLNGRWRQPAADGSGCCRREPALEAAAVVAAMLGIRHEFVDLERPFRDRVVEPFVEAYLAGLTPNPCVVCNRWIKFGLLMEHAAALGADTLATGHYCRIGVLGSGRIGLRKARDPGKDQSYFLFDLTQEQLHRIRFPLGSMTKRETRKLAGELGLPVADREESQEICFVADNDYAALLEAMRPGMELSGEIVDSAGEVLGRHDGFHRFTVGQRRGLGIPAGRPLYVLAIDPAAKRVVVGFEEESARGGLIAGPTNWVGIETPEKSLRAEVKVRSRAPAVPATLIPEGRSGDVRVAFDEPQKGIAPGQAAVFYCGELLLGGGWIRKD
jgi:tRNA-specific 2-thiouridylase